MKIRPLMMLMVLALGGCAPVPFQEMAREPHPPEDPRIVARRFQEALPESYQLLSTVVFEYNWRRYSGIGTLQVNRKDRSFALACMNPMGVKLFELSGDATSMTTHYVISDFSRFGDLASAVGDDVRRIYLDLSPRPDASVLHWRGKLLFRQPFREGFLEYVFAGSGGNLVEKNYYDEGGIQWRVSYYEYRDQQGKRWPQGIVYIHYQHGYRLTIRQKEFRV